MNKLKYLIQNSLNCTEKDRIALIHDKHNSQISQQIIEYLHNNKYQFKSFLRESHDCEELDKKTSQILTGNKYNVILLALKDNIWHFQERRDAKYKKGKRLASLLHPITPCESYSADFDDIFRIGTPIYDQLLKGKDLHITTASGTQLSAKIPGNDCIFFEDGNYSQPGSGGDFPAGETGFGPIRESVNGHLVIDSKVQHIGNMKRTPLILDIKKDKIVNVIGTYKPDFLNLIKTHPALKYLAEISFGINNVISETEEKSSIIEEKNLGTFHCGFGGNSSYGTRKGPHFDVVINDPKIHIDGSLLTIK